MAITIKDRFIKEDILDERGNKIGEIKFNPNDANIMKKLSKIINDLENGLEETNKITIPKLKEGKMKTSEDFEQAGITFKKIDEVLTIADNVICGILDDLIEIFGKETIEIFTGGTKDIDSLNPLLEFVLPYVKEAREKKINNYIPKKRKSTKNSDVME